MDEDGRKRRDIVKIFWHVLPLAALLLWGMLCMTDQLWYDEAFSAGLVMLPWRKLVYITAIDDHSPFYYGCLKLFYHLTMTGGGIGFRSLKLFSLMFMFGYMLLGKYYGARLFGRRISVWFMAFSLLAPIMTVQAGNVRMYAMALFFMTLTGFLAYDIYYRESRIKWILFALSSVCVMYCHTFAMIQAFWLYVVFLASLCRGRQFRKVKKCLLSGAAASALFSPWLFVTFRQMQLRMKYDAGSSDLAGIRELRDYFREWFSALETPINAVIWAGAAVFLILTIGACLSAHREKKTAALLGALVFLLTALTGFLVSALINNCFLGRYAFPGLGFIFLLYAEGMEYFKPRWTKGAILAASLFAFFLQYRSETALEYDGGLQAYESFWRENVRENDAVMGGQSHAVFLSVYHPEMDYYVDGYAEAELSFPNLQSCYDVRALAEGLKQDGGRTLWYITFKDLVPDKGEDGPDFEKVEEFHYMYYDFVIYRVQGRIRV